MKSLISTFSIMGIDNFLTTVFSPYVSDPKWYPFILIGLVLLVLLLIFFIFLFIRSFLAWVFGVNELIRLQKEQNHYLKELIALQDEQNDLLSALKSEKTETVIYQETPHKTQKKRINHEVAPEEYEEEDEYEEEITEAETEAAEKEVIQETQEAPHKKKYFFSKK